MPNWFGIIVGAASFFIIGIFHPIVIKCEYYFTDRIWPVFLILGLLTCGASLLIEDDLASALAGVLGIVLLWCIIELKEQKKRVERGWFPRNPSRGGE